MRARKTPDVPTIRRPTTITAVILAFNELDLLTTTLPPVKEVCDQLIVVDMGSTDGSLEYYESVLTGADQVVFYPRENLFRFGFAHPRNYGAKFAKNEWILAIDCDEYIEVDVTRLAIEGLATSQADCFSVSRLNYAKTFGYHTSDINSILQSCPRTQETHRRVYRNIPRIRFEGVIHEELWIEETNAYHKCENLPLVLHHLNQYKRDGFEHAKFGLYSYITLRAVLYPNMRYGTNEFWFTAFARQNITSMLEASNAFSRENGLPDIDEAEVKAQIEREL
ncbi:glycosyltransferase [Asticcacaulis sp. W401b]|uniref:glycosyltransferase n=1 Tax=Asticcacaulis sp. W401b TaxID=3388666 RepID=UPI00397056D7